MYVFAESEYLQKIIYHGIETVSHLSLRKYIQKFQHTSQFVIPEMALPVNNENESL